MSIFYLAKCPKNLYKRLKTPAAKKKDYLFTRILVELLMYNASADLCAAICPILKVLPVRTSLDPVLVKKLKLNVIILKNSWSSESP